MDLIQVQTLAIGDELLCGRISDTNSSYVAKELLNIGIRLSQCTVIEDKIETIGKAIEKLACETNVLICFGGLGPTSDDMTAEAVAKLTHCELVEDPASKKRIEEFCKKRGRTITPQVLKQCRYPSNAIPIPNRVGLAVGFHKDIGSCRCYFFPGVPEEMKAMFSDTALLDLTRKSRDVAQGHLRWHRFKCIGLPESELQRHMDEIEKALPVNMWLGYQTQFPENHLILYSREAIRDDFAVSAEPWLGKIRNILKPWIFTEEDLSLEQIVLKRLKEKNRRLALVESCTGGLVGRRLTEVPGSSENFWGSFVAYQVDAKAKMLGVELATAEDAVSQEASRRLAQNALAKSGCDYVAAITGYMGPGGGTEKDPVGTVYICLGSKQIEMVRIQMPDLGRLRNQWAASSHLLNLLRVELFKK